MSVYVDPLFEWPKTKKWPYGQACHMYADTPKELHEFARKMGLRREWCSDHTHGKDCTLLHYDLNPNMRAKAVRLGAKEVRQSHMVPYQAKYHPFFKYFREKFVKLMGEKPLVKNFPEWEVLWELFLAGAIAVRTYDKEMKK